MKNKIDYDVIENIEDPDVHILGLPKNLIDIKIDKDYKYKITNPITKIFSFILYMVSLLVFPIILSLKYGLIIKGRRNLRNIKSGAVSISNHIHIFDGAIVSQALFPKKLIFHSLETNFRIPVTRHLIRLLGCVPIPESISAKQTYIKATNQSLKEGRFVQIYPEASMWPNYTKIRPFKNGAFHFAVRNNVPIIPLCINFRQPRGIFKYFKDSDSLITVHIGKPLYPNMDLPFKECVEDLLNRSHKNIFRMNKYFKVLDKHSVEKLEIEKEEII